MAMRRTTRAAITRWMIRLVVLVAAVLVARALRASYTNGTTPGLEGQLAVRAFEVARTSFLRGDGFPLWDRSQCGGAPFLGNPDTTVLGTLVAGLFRVRGDAMVRGYLLVAAVIAVTGGYAWGRAALLVDRLPAFLVGVVFAASGGVAFHGNFRVHFAAIALLPWVLALARLGEKDLRAAVGAGIAFGVVGLEGGLYPIAFVSIALLVSEAPRVLAVDGGFGAVGRVLGITLALGLCLAAVKLVPMFSLLSLHPRHFVERDSPQWQHFFAMLGESEINRPPGLMYSADEYRGYVGPLIIGMGIAGTGTALLLKPRRGDLVALLLASMVLARGASSPYAPWSLLSKVPLFHQLNVPSRWILVVDLAVAGGAAVALHEAIRAVRRPHLVALMLVVGVFAAWAPLAAARKLYADLPRQQPLPATDPVTRPYQLQPGLEDLARKAENPMRNVGTDSCYSLSLELPAPRGLRMGEVPQAWMDAGSVTRAEVRQSGWVLDVRAPAPTIVHFNQTFSPDFQANIGRVQRNPSMTLDLAVPAGDHHIMLRHRPRGLVVGLVLTVGAVLASLAVFAAPVLQGIRRRRAA